jgi:hypothetical protein
VEVLESDRRTKATAPEDVIEDHPVATGATTIRQTDFGITPISVAGVVKVKNELALRWGLVGRPASR